MAKNLKTALVTGGARRIGKAIVSDLSAAGFAVAVHYHGSGEDARELVKNLNDRGGKVAIVRADLTDIGAVGGLLDDAASAIGPIGLLVNNASVFEPDELGDFTWEHWDRHFAVHLKAPVELSRRFAEALPQGEDGLVVNMIDQRVWKLSPRTFSYTLSKSALWTATQTMAQALAPRIRVNAIGPGPSLQGERQSEADFDAQIEAVLLRRGPELSEFGATIRYLWDTPSITGQMIALDGGQHLGWQTPDVTGIRE
ncbi:MAG: SDR family oxidoreductase [Hyphomicrobiales bacterium]|nr:SDR family oxidoreductase [Hyphomicrobiales bacterium]